MGFNGRQCLICGELHGSNLRVKGYEICAGCEGGLAAGRLSPQAALPGLRRLAVKTCLT
ncbi:MAG: hypothetical protein FWD25_03320 [Clostridia bacterium]|nr:hypothetical protein [Clostridia bacterium]